MLDFQNRVTVFAGHYGSGKTNLAVNYALRLREHHERVIIADLDIVNPYFRTADSRRLLERHGIRLIASDYVNTNVDVPAMPAETEAIFDGEDVWSVIDLGGDDRGSYALGRYRDRLLHLDTARMLLVVNRYRPLSRSADETVAILHEIEDACHVPFSGIVNNSNLGQQTTPETVLDSLAYAQSISRLTGLPVVATSARRDIAERLAGRVDDIFPMDLEDEKWQLYQK